MSIVDNLLFKLLFELMFYIPLNNFSVMSEAKQRIKCFVQGHNRVPTVRLRSGFSLSEVRHSSAEPLCSSVIYYRSMGESCQDYS